MLNYAAIFFSGVLFSTGLLMLKQPFFFMATSTTSLLDAMLWDTENEDEKQKRLISRLGKQLKWFVIFLGTIFLVFTVATAPITLLPYFGLTSEPDWQDPLMYLIMLAGSIFVFLLPLNKRKQDYSYWSILLHKMLLDNYNLSLMLFRIEKKKVKGKVPDKNFVIVTGLARAGTTALTTLLHQSGKFHSLSYANMPFLLAPNLWRKLYKPSETKLKERAHGDKVLVGYNSVEALEEYFFKVKLEDSYIGADSLEKHEVNQDVYLDYQLYQELVKTGREKSVYLAKNNNLLLRYESMRRFNPDFTIILLFRNPTGHAESLLKQHLRFCKMQDEQPFVLSYMNWLGHHEFGNNQKPFNFGESVQFPEDKTSLDYWLLQWIAYYSWILNLPEDKNLLMIDYDDFVSDPSGLFRELGEKLDIDLSALKAEKFEKSKEGNHTVDPALETQAQEIFQRLRQKKVHFTDRVQAISDKS